MKLRLFSVLYMQVPVLAVLATWATGFWGSGIHGGVSEYGFPFPWKTVEFLPVCNGCPEPTGYNWGFFVLDVAFYTAIGNGIVFLYTRLVGKQQDHLVDKVKSTSVPSIRGRKLVQILQEFAGLKILSRNLCPRNPLPQPPNLEKCSPTVFLTSGLRSIVRGISTAWLSCADWGLVEIGMLGYPHNRISQHIMTALSG